MSPVLDWTAGGTGIAYQACPACHAKWYFKRGFCPACGTPGPESRQASGQGTVCAVTLVARAPSEELRQHAPYLICLVETDEGFRVMAHGKQGLCIGDRVQAKFVELAGRLLPFFDNI
jgi:uncharacterized OB-fold protein